MSPETAIAAWKMLRNRRLRWLWWSFTNRLKGYKFGPIQRFRCCDHTTPYHDARCDVGLVHRGRVSEGSPLPEER